MAYHPCIFNCGGTDCPAPNRVLPKKAQAINRIKLQKYFGEYKW